MIVLASPRLPGIRIDIAPPPPAEVLPRMDIAVFVGFAATGPMHRPVAVESVAQFVAVFGPDAPLAWDAAKGERLYANLGPAVRGFFANGGRRCWVIRVARTAALEAVLQDGEPGRGIAIANRFALPGILSLAHDGTGLAPAIAQARSLGSWSDSLRVQAALAEASFELSNWALLSAQPPRFAFATRLGLQAGDLIVFGRRPEDALADAPVYARLDSVSPLADRTSGARRAEATICACFEAFGPTSSPPGPTLGEAEVSGVLARPFAARLDRSPDPAQANKARLTFEEPVPPGLVEGYWARWSAKGETVWLRIDDVETAPARSQPGMVNAMVAGAAWREAIVSLPPAAPARASVLTLDLRVVALAERAFRASGLGLTPAHGNSWWRKAGDDVFYAAQYGQPRAGAEPDVRFPLAALNSEVLLSSEERPDRPAAWIPLGVTPLYGAFLGPLPQTASALERDGLSHFGADLFLDPELAGLRANDVSGQADVIRYLSPSPRNLFGAHAALEIGTDGLFNEASLICLPDAAHVGWSRRIDLVPPLPRPAPLPPPPHWFTHRGPCAAAPPGAVAERPDFANFLDCDERALTAPALSGPAEPVRPGWFRLSWTGSEEGAEYQLQEARRSDFEDAPAIPLYQGYEQHHDVIATRPGFFYYRVRAILGEAASTFSNAVTVVVSDDEWVAVPPETFGEAGEGELLRLHRSVLRLAAATGEIFAVLGLPRHYRAANAAAYAARLRAEPEGSSAVTLEGFDFSERRVLSYGALYHPWVAGPTPAPPLTDAPVQAGEGARGVPARAPLQVAPPDGVVTGMFAARALLRGAWIAPANVPFSSVVALTPPIGAENILDASGGESERRRGRGARFSDARGGYAFGPARARMAADQCAPFADPAAPARVAAGCELCVRAQRGCPAARG